MNGIALVLMCCLVPFQVQGCQVSRLPGRRERIRYLDELLRNSNGSVFIESTAKFQSDAERHKVFKPVLGERLELVCNIRNTMERFTHRINMSQYPVWNQNGLQLRLDGDNLQLMPKEYYSCLYRADLVSPTHFSSSFNWTTGVHTLVLENVSQGHAGVYECYARNPDHFAAIQTYAISPVITAQDIFDPPMENVSASIGDTVQMRCFVKFDQLSGNFNDRFIWRHGEYIIFAPEIPIFASVTGTMRGFGGNMQGHLNSTYGCHSLLTIRKVDERHAGLYQCWFKFDDLLGGWVVQSIYLRVTS